MAKKKKAKAREKPVRRKPRWTSKMQMSRFYKGWNNVVHGMVTKVCQQHGLLAGTLRGTPPDLGDNAAIARHLGIGSETLKRWRLGYYSYMHTDALWMAAENSGVLQDGSLSFNRNGQPELRISGEKAAA